ncbi:MAG: hypothetical protein EPN85_05170 [Bacteroidetes bacterium]|nr:MAG: hypothetical protein EPN85_05170 [Bacteroidota bacterium]
MDSPIKNKFDSGWIGFSAGLSAPAITLYIFYLVKYSHLSFQKFYMDVLFANNIVTSSISLCVITNLLVFFIFIWTNRNLAARGVLFSTFIYAGYVVYQKYIR